MLHIFRNLLQQANVLTELFTNNAQISLKKYLVMLSGGLPQFLHLEVFTARGQLLANYSGTVSC